MEVQGFTDDSFEGFQLHQGDLTTFRTVTSNTITTDNDALAAQCRHDVILARFYIHAIFAGICSVFGVVANVISFVVIGRDTATSPVASLLLRSLACADTFFLVNWILSFTLHYVIEAAGLEGALNPAWMYIRMLAYPLVFVGQTATIWLTVLIAGSRFVAVCLPYRAHDYCSLRRVRASVLVLVFFSILYNVPRYFEAEVVHIPSVNGTRYELARTTLIDNFIYRQVYFDIAYYVVSFILPLLLLTVFNTWLIAAYRAKERRREAMYNTDSYRNGVKAPPAPAPAASPGVSLKVPLSQGGYAALSPPPPPSGGGETGAQQRQRNRESQEQNITLVMIVVIVVFLLCNTPARVVQIVSEYKEQFCLTPAFFIIEISIVLEVLNSSTNFLIYFCIRKWFRRTFLRMVCPVGVADAVGRRGWHGDDYPLTVYTVAPPHGAGAGAGTVAGLGTTDGSHCLLTQCHKSCVGDDISSGFVPSAAH